MAIDVMRLLMSHANRDDVSKITVEVHERVAAFLNNRKRKDITQLEETYDVSVTVDSKVGVGPEHLKFHCSNATGTEVRILAPVDSKLKS